MNNPINIEADVTEPIKDLTKQPLKSAGAMIATAIDFVHNTALYPLQKWNIRVEHNLEEYAKDLREKAQRVPEDKRIEPNLNIWGKTTDALKWNMDDEQAHIREMFTNILMADIDKDLKEKVQPAFIEIVGQLSPSDAQLLDGVFKKHPAVNLYEQRTYTRKIGEPKPQEHFVIKRYITTIKGAGKILDKEFEKNLDNLKRLGIINEDSGYWGDKKIAKKFEKHGKWLPFDNNPTHEYMTEIVQNRRLKVTDFGKDFLDICLR